MKDYDVIVIGGGLLGCFAARNLCRRKMHIALLEAREDVCTGISRANTAIVSRESSLLRRLERGREIGL